MKQHHSPLLSVGFITGLLLLLLNDFYLKANFGNAFTGKLSDVAGLFIFPLFWAVFFPANKKVIYLSTALFFIYWKSAASQPLIETLNSVLPIEIGRTVDMSDLLALMVLPFSYLYFTKPFSFKFYPTQVLMMGLAAFAFMATSKRKITVMEYSKTWNFDVSKDELKLKMMALDVMEIKFMKAAEYTLYKDSVAMEKYHFTTTDTNQILKTIALDNFQDEQELVFSDTLVPIQYEALIKLQGKGNTSSLEVKHFNLWEIDNKIVAEQKKLVPVHFEQQVIEKLK